MHRPPNGLMIFVRNLCMEGVVRRKVNKSPKERYMHGQLLHVKPTGK